MVNSLNINIDLSKLTGVSANVTQAPIAVNEVCMNTIQGALLFNVNKGQQVLTLLAEDAGTHINFHLAKHDPEKDVKGNLAESFKYVEDRTIVSFVVGTKEYCQEMAHLYDPKTKLPLLKEMFTHFESMLLNNCLNQTNLVTKDEVVPFFNLLQGNNLVSSVTYPSPYKVKDIQLSRDEKHPNHSVSIIQKTTRLDDGGTQVELGLARYVTEFGDESLQTALDASYASLNLKFDASFQFKEQSVHTAIGKLQAAMQLAVNNSNHVNELSDWFVGHGRQTLKDAIEKLAPSAEFKIPELPKYDANRPNFKAGGYKAGNKPNKAGGNGSSSTGEPIDPDAIDYTKPIYWPLYYWMDALEQKGLIRVDHSGAREAEQQHYRLSSASGTAKFKFANMDMLRLASRGAISFKKPPNLGMDVHAGTNIRGGYDLISQLVKRGVLPTDSSKTEDQIIKGHYSACLKTIQNKDFEVDLQAIGNSISTSFAKYALPMYTHRAPQKGTDELVRIFDQRGIDRKVLSVMLNQQIIGVTQFKKGRDVLPTEVARLHVGLDHSANGFKTVQEYHLLENKETSKISLDKRYLKHGSNKGLGVSILGNSAKSIVFFEAVMDMAAAYEMTHYAKLNSNDYHYVSVMSAGSLGSWLANATGGYRPATLKESLDGHRVMLDKVVEEEIGKEDALENIKEFFRDYEKVFYMTNRNSGNEYGRQCLENLFSEIGLSSLITKVPEGNTYFKSYAPDNGKKGKVHFNETNIHSFLSDLGVKFDDKANVVGFVSKYSSTEPVEGADLIVARKKIVEKLGVERLVLAFDLDGSGMKMSQPFIAFLEDLNLSGNVMTLPVVSAKKPEINGALVSKELRDNADDFSKIQSFYPFDLVNDMNDALNLVKGLDPRDRRVAGVLAGFHKGMTANLNEDGKKYVENVTNVMELRDLYRAYLKEAGVIVEPDKRSMKPIEFKRASVQHQNRQQRASGQPQRTQSRTNSYKPR